MILVTAVLLLLASSTCATTFSPCDNILPPTSLEIEGCDKEPCELIRGGNIIGYVNFTAVNTITLTTLVSFTIEGTPIDVPIPQPDACQSLDVQCPLAAGQELTYTFNWPILSIFPKVSIVFEVNLVDDSKISVTCFKLKTIIVDHD